MQQANTPSQSTSGKSYSSEAIWETVEEMKSKYPQLSEVTLLCNKNHSFQG